MEAPRPVTGLMSQTARQVMRKDSRLPELPARRTAQAPSIRAAAGMALSASEPSLGRSGAGRPSTVARRENRRWDALDTLRGRTGTGSFALGRRRSEDGRSGSRRDSVEQMAETFGRDMRGVTDRLEDIVRNLRFEDLKSKQEKEERKRREEEQQELEEKRKATRRKEQAISDPRKKVAMKIENFRQNCPVDSPDFPGEIPMCPVQVEGPLGPETVTMVDVEQLRSRCLPLGRIEDLMDLRRREKKPKRDELLAFSPRSTGQKSQNSTLSLGSSMQPGNLTWEERRRQAHAKRQAAKVEAILRKLCSMRSGLPTDMHIDSAALQACLDYERMTGPINDLESLQALVAERLNGFIDSLANKLAADPDSGKTKLLVSLGKLSQAAIGEQLNMSQRMLGRLPSPKSTKTMDDNALKFARRFRCRRAWAIVRATIQWTRVFSAVKSRNRHIEIIKVSLGQLGEWARVKTAMKKAVLSVRHIQQNARRFLAQKRERCKQIEREWEMIEDANLELFYDKFNRKLVKQKMAQAGFSEKARKGNKRGLYKQMLNSIKGSGVSNWRDFRIPVAAPWRDEGAETER
ncbi:Hypothetical protein SCF082_LOCUS50475 [Durusdinium trenchii]|uniref:Uncharacterized protein n=1 Tax=Durusdinium trenchii TaxID=1381693 RepID=A0ABP0S8B7_9DINO